MTFSTYNTKQLFYEGNNEIIKLFCVDFCVFNKSMFRTILSNKIFSAPININGSISYEGILKDNKLSRCDSFVSFCIYHES